MIKIQNIYYMLTYVFSSLNEKEYKKMAMEEFEDTLDLLAAILSKGMAQLIKRGLGRAYVRNEEILAAPKGKMNLTTSIKMQTLRNKQVVCEFDEFSEDIFLNQLIKSTALLLIRSKEVNIERKKSLKKVLLVFEGVSEIDVQQIAWQKIQYDKNNRHYQMLINICYLIVNRMLINEKTGQYDMQHYEDEMILSSLYERFIRAYYQRHYSNLRVSAAKIPWNLSLEGEEESLLPDMKTDITLTDGEKTLIIDAKFYRKSLQYHAIFNKRTFHSGNLYQLFTYVKNRDREHTGNVAGVLLYAKTDEEIVPDNTYMMDKNKMTITNLDLDGEFECIRSKLNQLVDDFFCTNISRKLL